MHDIVNRLPPSKPPTISRFAAHIHRPGQLLPGTYIPSPRLESAVQAFLMQHQLPDESPATPRTLLVQGPPGIGKTESTLRAALAMNIAVLLLPPSIFGSKHEGGGTEAVTEALQEAERFSRCYQQPIAAFFDDVDHSTLTVGDNTGHTVNTADVIGHLQNLSGNRRLHVTHAGLPIPLLATANDASRIAPSLFRQMRAKVITHTVEPETKHALARSLFAPATTAEHQFIDKLYRTYAKEPIAFWPALHSDYKAARIQAVMKATGFDPAAVQKALAARRPLDTALITKLAAACRSARPMNFLWANRTSE
ncbi:MAG: AAA family ATPase [Hyphomicrobiaceae bacterium]